MATNLTMHISNFNDRIKGMNQLRQTELRLTSVEANNLHSDIFALLAQVSRLQSQLEDGQTQVTQVVMDGGGFK
jgi:peptidoglycan hydrolase CwlO-like protein